MQNEGKKENGIKWDFSLNERYFVISQDSPLKAYRNVQCISSDRKGYHHCLLTLIGGRWTDKDLS